MEHQKAACTAAEARLVSDIYEATLNPSLWESITRQLAEITDAEKSALFAYDRLNPAYSFSYSHGVSDDIWRLYRDGGFANADLKFTGKWVESAGLGVATANHVHFGNIENFKREAGRYYSDFLAKIGTLYLAGGLLEKGDYRWSVLGLHRGDTRPFEDELVKTIGRLLPHIRRALAIRRQFTDADAKSGEIYSLLDQLCTGAILVDQDVRVIYANPSAKRILVRREALGLSDNNSLQAHNKEQQKLLDDMILGASRLMNTVYSPASSPNGGVLQLYGDGTVKLALTIVPFKVSTERMSEVVFRGTSAAIFLSDSTARHQLSRRLLKESFLLSERECDVCETFLECAALEGVADQLDLTLASVRAYMRAIFEKTGRHSQVDLVRLLMGLTVNFEHIL